jgi:hypothetical protein
MNAHQLIQARARYEEDSWQTMEAASAQLKREVADARRQIAAADEAVRSRGRPRVAWTDDMLATLYAMRDEGRSLYVCAVRIGVGYAVCVHKAHELGLASRMSRGPRTGVRVMREAHHGR